MAISIRNVHVRNLSNLMRTSEPQHQIAVYYLIRLLVYHSEVMIFKNKLGSILNRKPSWRWFARTLSCGCWTLIMLGKKSSKILHAASCIRLRMSYHLTVPVVANTFIQLFNEVESQFFIKFNSIKNCFKTNQKKRIICYF